MTFRVCVIWTEGCDNILHVYGPESQCVTCSMIKGWSDDPCVEDVSNVTPDLTLESAVDRILSVIILFVPLIHINAISSTITHIQNEITHWILEFYVLIQNVFMCG